MGGNEFHAGSAWRRAEARVHHWSDRGVQWQSPRWLSDFDAAVHQFVDGRAGAVEHDGLSPRLNDGREFFSISAMQQPMHRGFLCFGTG